MRTTVDLADDVSAAVADLRRERGLGLSEAVNELARAGLARRSGGPYVHRSLPLGIRVDVSDIGAVLETLDAEAGPEPGPRS